MEDRDLNDQNDPDRPGSGERPDARGDAYDPRPDTEDVYQDTDPSGTSMDVPVCVRTPVRTQELPTELGALLSVQVPSVAAGGRPVRLLTADPRRRVAHLEIPATETLRLGASQASAASGYAYRLRAATAGPGYLQLTSCDELWGVGEDGTFLVSVANEQWSM